MQLNLNHGWAQMDTDTETFQDRKNQRTNQ